MMKRMDDMKDFIMFVNKLDDYFLNFSVALMGLVLFIQIVMRYIFNQPLIWSEELARYLFIWMAFIGIGYGVKYDLHIKMEAFLQIFPPKVQQVVVIITEVVAILFLGLVLIPGVQFAIHTGHVPSSAMGIPMYWVYFAFPVGLILGMLRMMISVVQQFSALRKKG